MGCKVRSFYGTLTRVQCTKRLKISYLEHEIPEPQDGRKDAVDSVGHAWRYLQNGESETQGVEPFRVVNALDFRATRLTQVLVLARRQERELFGKFSVPLKTEQKSDTMSNLSFFPDRMGTI